MEWKLTTEELPKRNDEKAYSQVWCLVSKRYDWKRGDNEGHYYQTQILVFNHEHECWDQEDGDDYDCDINQVKYWMYLPEPPKKVDFENSNHIRKKQSTTGCSTGF